MVLKGKGKIHEPVRGRIMIYIPAKVHQDSVFPFKPKDEVEVRIEGEKLIIERLKA